MVFFVDPPNVEFNLVISGSPFVGVTVSAQATAVRPASGIGWSFQWLRDGVAIPGATASTYRVTGADACGPLSVRVIGNAPDHLPDVRTATPVTAGFRDIPSGYPFRADVCWMARTGITTGDGQGNFGPNELLTRDALAAFLYRYAGSPAVDLSGGPRFADVPATQRFYREIQWLASTGITTGWTQGGRQYFGPGESLTRADTAAFLWRYEVNVLGNNAARDFRQTGPSPFADVEPSHHFYQQICWMKATGITTGSVYNGSLQYGPTLTTKRFEFAAFLHRLDTSHP
jgi:hypothetical protein